MNFYLKIRGKAAVSMYEVRINLFYVCLQYTRKAGMAVLNLRKSFSKIGNVELKSIRSYPISTERQDHLPSLFRRTVVLYSYLC